MANLAALRVCLFIVVQTWVFCQEKPLDFGPCQGHVVCQPSLALAFGLDMTFCWFLATTLTFKMCGMIVYVAELDAT